MPKARSGYARLAQTEEEDELYESDHEGLNRTISSPSTRHAPIQPQRRQDRMHATGRTNPFYGRQRSNSGVDIKAINARLERWADEIASKFKIRRGKRAADEEQPEIQHSVFQAPEGMRPATAETLQNEHANDTEGRITKMEFDDAVEAVRVAIELGTHPTLISQGSSGSYFARNSSGKILAVFKPKDEEPYASKNPKWTKWIHRNLFPFFFGRACLIPNLSYISEAAAYILDQRLQTNIVPYTDIVSLSSKSFHYDFWDRRAYYRKKKALPEKQGSFQMFLKGYKDATQFLKQHPWPDQQGGVNAPRRKKRRRWTEDCRPSGQQDSEDEAEASGEGRPNTTEETDRRKEFWTDKLQQSLREELEKLVVLDYIMRNTDRGLDNWMIRIDRKAEEASIVVEPPKEDGKSRHASPNGMNGHATGPLDEPYTRQVEQMTAVSRTGTPMTVPDEDEATVSLGAIDNSLSWPWKHPDAWRSYPFGWLFLPVSLIGQPFSESTRKHFLPLLSSKVWWAETQLQLRRCFMQDADFQERMYAKQIAVMKGQAWNVLETLKTPDHGPLELTRRARVCVWDDLVDVPVVVPMRAPSIDTKRKQARERGDAFDETEEMDISAARASAPQPQHDLLGMPSPKAPERPLNNLFNVSRQPSQTDVRESTEMTPTALSPNELLSFNSHNNHSPNKKKENQRTSESYFRPRNNPRMSYEEPRRQQGRYHQRRFSLGPRTNSNSNPFLDDGDEGDLGFAAAEDREGNRKRVIVERLEPVKSKHPVFTWC